MPSFFFQAEDGIRAPLVTGVQTCALPISPTTVGTYSFNVTFADTAHPPQHTAGTFAVAIATPPSVGFGTQPANSQIGRASCRERVGGSGVAGHIKRDTGSDLTGSPSYVWK